ncbi:hypothetical protein Mesil_1350 [Allomeiothermus silvanus DSM 9946]|uniref:Uncharacterized protein n=1 Tax=Allomeiothermus silvanus (strain ATCC 700542 / DSM 9946 / NBRC 106475 / NCIMB 13440 / VI-R2) TaxID=526227 RepID=D7BEK0_ALLS1|nr:hypothetical protein [Allomeiothermus silvanus]ADH63243.1 hypothetical protein Mesil_1350 [Allomeiothermus silvanus DSM 9946]
MPRKKRQQKPATPPDPESLRLEDGRRVRISVYADTAAEAERGEHQPAHTVAFWSIPSWAALLESFTPKRRGEVFETGLKALGMEVGDGK